MSAYNIQICRSEYNHQWDNFLTSVNAVSYLQTSLWTQIKLENNFEESHLRIIVRLEEKILAGAQITIRKYPTLGKIGYINHGPCFICNNILLFNELIQQLKILTKKEKLLYLTIKPNYWNNFDIKHLHEQGIHLSNSKLPPFDIIQSTLLIDLSKSEDLLLSEMDPRRRRNLNKGLKFNYETRLGTRDDIPLFYRLMTEACSRRNTTPSFNDINYFYAIWDQFACKNWVMIHLAEVHNKPVCAAFCIAFGNTFKFDLWGWNGEYANERISETFLWKNILWAKENGFKYYENVELDLESLKYIKSGGKIPASIQQREMFGATYFKLRWGGDAIIYPKNFTVYRNKLVQFILIMAFKTIMSEKFIRGIRRLIIK